MKRRRFVEITGAAGAAALGQAQLQQDARKFDAYGVLIGPEAARPAPEGEYFAEFDTYQFAYFATDGGAYTLTDRDGGWRGAYAFEPGVTLVDEANDLPAPENGVHQLDGQTTYFFTNFVASPYSLDPNGSPLIGYHGATSGFIHTGGQTAITSSSGLFMRNVYVHAPFGQVFDIVADQSTEMLVESCVFSDAAGIGQILDLGTFDGMRVPTFKGCNFEDFAGGLTFTGSPDSVFVSNSPMRGVTASGVTILEFDAGLDVGIVDLPDNYVKDVQSDTEVVNVDPNATVREIFQYVKNTHDASVTQSNILTGAAGTDVVGYRVKNSFPIVDSVAIGNYSLDNDSTVSITSQATDKDDAAAYVTVPGTTTSEVSARFDMGNNAATYRGKKDTQTELSANLTLDTKNGDLIAVAWFNDGSIVPGTATRFVTQGSGFSVGTPTSSLGVLPNCTTGTTYDIRVANLDSTDDIDVGELNGLLQADV